MANKKILITGSSGYIGKHLVDYLYDRDYDLTGIDINADSNYKCPTYVFDITDKNQFDRLSYMHFDAVIHLAALVKVGESVKMPFKYFDTNVNGMTNVLDQINFDHFIFASTGAAQDPNSPYAYSKRIAEYIIEDECDKYTIFRFYNVIGSNGHAPTNEDGLMHNLMRAKYRGQFDLFGYDYPTPDGTAIRDYIHVNEICGAIERSISNPSNSVEHLGHGEGHSVLEMVKTYKRVNNEDFTVVMQPRRRGDVAKTVLDNPSKFFVPEYSLDEMLKVS